MERLIPSHITSGEDAWEAWEWEPAQTLSHCVERGVAYPRRAFRIYLKPKSSGIDRAILSFTRDDQLVLQSPFRGRATPPCLEEAPCKAFRRPT